RARSRSSGARIPPGLSRGDLRLLAGRCARLALQALDHRIEAGGLDLVVELGAEAAHVRDALDADVEDLPLRIAATQRVVDRHGRAVIQPDRDAHHGALIRLVAALWQDPELAHVELEHALGVLAQHRAIEPLDEP